MLRYSICNLNISDMTKEYVVVKEFGLLSVGDKLTWNPEKNVYVFTEDKHSNLYNYTHSVHVEFNETMAEDYAEAGYLEPLKEADNTEDALNSNDTAIVQKLRELITTLKDKYNKRNDDVAKKYAAHKMQTCQKVEHDTVYFNLMKLLNKFEEIINE